MRSRIISCLVLAAAGCGQAWRQWTWQSPGPGPREGHSFVQWNNSAYLFGGRGNDISKEHNPKTYEVESVDGDLQFITYDTRPTFPCAAGLTNAQCYNISVGQLHNDIWEYDVDCFRFDDYGCMSDGWRRIDPGAYIGGCRIESGEYICTHPNERYDHVATVFDDGVLFVYGGFSRWCQDFCSDMWTFDIVACKDRGVCTWNRLGELGRMGPADRWRAATVAEGNRLFMFGGHRLWHGFARGNTRGNLWESTEAYPAGGYLDDMWIYEHSLNATDPGEWFQVLPQESCYDTPGRLWEERFDITCTIIWPEKRASAAISLADGGLYLFGGYTSYFPYPDADSAGAGSGVARATADLAAGQPYGPSVHYLGDFHFYNFTTGLWDTVVVHSDVSPPERRGHVLVTAPDTLLLVAGYRSNYFQNDLWQFNRTTRRWLRIDAFPHALYPDLCTSDSIPLSDGTDFILSSSVFGQPTRGFPVDGSAGRATDHVFIKQPRRQAPGWDGCRDRNDFRPDMPEELQVLQYSEPIHRFGHQGFFSSKYELLLLYGGVAYTQEHPDTPSKSFDFEAVDDMWQFSLNRCIKNCSNHGTCQFGRCFCEEGYYGSDCSNVTCPGDFCFYDQYTHQQVCKHCCHAVTPEAEHHVAGHVYNERKVACNHEHPGASHGICNGFGKCQCRPPFIGEDCSIRDCPDQCNGNGYCSAEYPVGRCVCDPGFGGLSCNERKCDNRTAHLAFLYAFSSQDFV